MSSAQGEDRSDFQAVLPPVDRNGRKLDFIFFKATEGVSWVSQTYARNVALAKQSGVPFGSYHFFHPSLDVAQQIALFMATVAEHGGLIPGAMLAADSEITAGANGELLLQSDRSHLLTRDAQSGVASIRPGVDYPHHLLSRSTPKALDASLVGSTTHEFLRGVRTAVEVALGGDYCQEVVYTYENMLPQLAGCTDFDLWIAYYNNSAPPSVAPFRSWVIWQYAGGGGNGGSDQNGANGDVAWFEAWRTAKMPKPGPTPSPAPSPPPGHVTFSVTMPVLKVGMADHPGTVDYVHRLQWELAGLSAIAALPECVGLVADGNFGPKTELAVKRVQVFANLAKDMSSASGQCGAAEWQFVFAGTRGNA